MAVTVYEITGRDADKRAGEYRLTRQFYVSLDTVSDDGPALAAVAVGVNGQSVPIIGEGYPGIYTATANSIRPQAVEGIFTDFIVTVEYTTAASDPDEDDIPLNRPWTIQWGNITETIAIDHEISSNPLVDGLPIMNSAYRPFDPPYEIGVARPTLTVVRNERTFGAFTAIQYVNALNSDVFVGQGPLTAKCTNIAGRRFFEQNEYWWEVTYEFLFKPYITLYNGPTPSQFSGHSLTVLDIGLMQLNAAGTDWTPCLDESGNQTTEARLLDGSGRQIPFTPGVPPNPYFKVFEINKAIPFSPLGLAGI